MNETSMRLFEEAKKIIPGGVNSPVRAFKAVGGLPPFMCEARGGRIKDVDGREYVDYVMSWGPLILGHAHPAVVEAIKEQAAKGTSYGAPTALEVGLAELIIEAFPSLDMVRMMSSGTEAVMTAIRLARAFTGREKIVKFEGCYHGHADSLLVKAGSGVATLGIPGSPGIPKQLAELTLTVPFNDLASIYRVFEEHGREIAAVIVEPAAGNMGVVAPSPGFLDKLNILTKDYGSLLIFDEVITGFRLTWGGYQRIAGIDPDLTCLGKIIGGGLPVGAVGGKRTIMEQLAPIGPVYQAGTLSGNPLAMAAGIATLALLQHGMNYYEEMDRLAFSLCEELKLLFADRGIPVTINRMGSMFTVFFAGFFRGMLKNGISLPPSQFEAWFLSLAHNHEDMEKTLAACAATLANL
jgi:glutamate-1-semialdehyde 2,1-aminomutase